MSSRLFAIGDIHGCDIALETLLQRLELSRDDTVVVLGDIVDRRPNTRRAIELLLDLAVQCRVVGVLGNHEEMMLRVLDGAQWIAGWLVCGGDAALASYGGVIDDVPETHRQFMEAMLPYFETDTEIFVHAGVTPHLPLFEQDDVWLRWESTRGTEDPHFSGKRVICGHTPQETGLPRVSDGWICLDTSAHAGGWLSCLDVRHDVVYQSNQRGEYRILRLP